MTTRFPQLAAPAPVNGPDSLSSSVKSGNVQVGGTAEDEPRWVTCEWLDGPALAGWLRVWVTKHFSASVTDILGPRAVKTMRRWVVKGEHPSVAQFDAIFAPAGGHLSEVPDELWLTERPASCQRHRGIDPQLRAAVLEAVAAGESIREVARRTGVGRRNIQHWLKAAK